MQQELVASGQQIAFRIAAHLVEFCTRFVAHFREAIPEAPKTNNREAIS